MLNGKHKFSVCIHCNSDLFFEDKRKRTESGKWAHTTCFEEGGFGPYPIPHQIENGKKHTGDTAPYKVAVETKAKYEERKPTGVLESLVADMLKHGAMDMDKVREIVKEEVTSYVPKVQTLEIIRPDMTKVEIKDAHMQFEKLLRVISFGKHAYLYGAPGSFKSTTAHKCATALNRAYAYSSLNPQTPESRLLGFINASGQYVETEFYKLYRDGGVFCIDEMDNGSAALLNTLNSLLDNGHGSFPCGTIPRHPNFVIVATGNTNGNGASVQFPDRRAFDKAFKERFACIEWNYDNALEQAITLSINPKAKPWLEWVRNVRQYILNNDIELVCSPRASFNGALFLKDETFTVAEIAEMVVFKGMDADTRNNILRSHSLPNIEGRTI